MEEFYGPCTSCRGELRATMRHDDDDQGDELAPATVVTRRRRRAMTGRVMAAWAWQTGDGLTADGEVFATGVGKPICLVLDALPAEVERVLIVGPRMFDTIDELRLWCMDSVPDDWTPGAHWLPDIDAPVLRYRRPDGSKVELLPASTWFGDTADYTCADVLDAWRQLASQLLEDFGLRALLPTPASTGMECLRASLPRGVDYPVLSDELRQLITSTSGQGRMEVFSREARELPELVEVDGRFMYSVTIRGVPVGVPKRTRVEPRDPYTPARHLARWIVPGTWTGPGLLPSKGNGRSWRYAREPFEQAEGWIDGAELLVARNAGWHVEVIESIVWPKNGGADPLRTWAEKMRAARASASPLLRAAYRSLVITAIGALVSRPYMVTRWAPVDRPELIPTGALNARTEGYAIVYELPERNRWRDENAHPEWAASCWAKTRARLLSGPGVGGERTGLLHLPDGIEPVAVAVDAMYLTGDPGWGDDGKDGRLRLKHRWPGPLPAPTGRTDLYRLLGGLR